MVHMVLTENIVVLLRFLMLSYCLTVRSTISIAQFEERSQGNMVRASGALRDEIAHAASLLDLYIPHLRLKPR
jgi:hypothetical protein